MIANHDPAAHFAYPQCDTCTVKPCVYLRCGGFTPGTYTFVHRRHYGYPDCPLAARSIHEVREYLETLPFHSLIDHLREVLSLLTELEYVSYRQEYFVNSFDDTFGQISLILHLMQEEVIVAVGIPFDYRFDEKIRRWFDYYRRQLDDFPGEVYREDDLEESALTDQLIGQEKEPLSITNPRWEHVDEQKKSDIPAITSTGDEITLMVDISGAPHGAGVDFTVYDVGGPSPTVAGKVHGRNENGVGKATWVVDDPRKDGEDWELKLEFEGEVRSKVSERAEINIEIKEFSLSF